MVIKNSQDSHDEQLVSFKRCPGDPLLWETDFKRLSYDDIRKYWHECKEDEKEHRIVYYIFSAWRNNSK